ncbi:MAG: flagellar hook-basal body complex protein FliE [Alphaproteobacteria bacterium]|nr:flagellar hook-basal body complex protein FliE [Alphaproteobacteria bacterium]
MTQAITNALNAYQAAAKRAILPEDHVEGVQSVSPAGSFAEMLHSAAKQAEQDNKRAEFLSMKAVNGTADMQEVVMAVENAEFALQTVVAVRDKVVSAYQDILQMPI